MKIVRQGHRDSPELTHPGERRLRLEMEENNQQLEVYAKELRQHFLEERRLRQETEQRVREISALNQLFQRHLSEEFDIVQSYQQMLETLKSLSTQMHSLVARAESVQLPEPVDVSEPAPDGG